jgi:hypothetical protein
MSSRARLRGRWREHWRGAKAVFPFWEVDGGSIYPAPSFTRWSLNNGAVRRLTRYGPAVYLPGSSGNEVETAGDNPITFSSGEPYTLALLIRWTSVSGPQGIFRSGSSSNPTWLWVVSSSSRRSVDQVAEPKHITRTESGSPPGSSNSSVLPRRAHPRADRDRPYFETPVPIRDRLVKAGVRLGGC